MYSARRPVTGVFYFIVGFVKAFYIMVFFSFGGATFGGDAYSYLLFLNPFGAGDLLGLFSSGGKATYF